MTGFQNPLQAFVSLLARRQLPFIGAFLVLFVIPHLILTESVLLPLALVSCGLVGVLVDRHTIALVPTAFPTEQSRQVAHVLTVAGGLVVSFIGLTSAGTPGKFGAAAALILLLRVAAPVGFGLFAYPSFRDDIMPLLQKLGADTPAFREALRERAALKGVEHRQRQDREAAVREARNRVVAYYREHRRHLRRRFHPTWVETEIRARIPDEANDEAAYAAASELIALFVRHCAEQDERREEVGRQLAEVRAAWTTMQNSSDVDPELQREELAELSRRERELLGALATLSRAA